MNTRTIRFLSGLGAALIFSVSLAGCRLLGNAEGSSAMTGGTSAGDTNGGESAGGGHLWDRGHLRRLRRCVRHGHRVQRQHHVHPGLRRFRQRERPDHFGGRHLYTQRHPDRRPGGGRRREGGHGAADTERRVHHLREQRPALREKGGQNHPDPGRRHPKRTDGRRILHLPRRRNRRTQRGGLLEKRPDHQRRRHTDRYRPVQQRHRVQGRADHHRRHHPGNGRGRRPAGQGRGRHPERHVHHRRRDRRHQIHQRHRRRQGMDFSGRRHLFHHGGQRRRTGGNRPADSGWHLYPEDRRWQRQQQHRQQGGRPAWLGPVERRRQRNDGRRPQRQGPEGGRRHPADRRGLHRRFLRRCHSLQRQRRHIRRGIYPDLRRRWNSRGRGPDHQ